MFFEWYSFRPEGIISLGKEAENSHYHSAQHLRRSRVYAYYLYKKFEAKVIDNDATYHYAQISGYLYPFFQRRIGECYISIEPETAHKGDDKLYEKRTDMRFKHQKPQVEILFR